jgi:hypothetical protein
MWGGAIPQHYALTEMPVYRNSGLMGFSQGYRTAHDYVNISNKGTGLVTAFGGTSRGVSSDITILPFDFAKATVIDSDYFMTLQSYFYKNIPYSNTEFATLTFWIMKIPK